MIAFSWYKLRSGQVVHRPDSPPHRVRHLLQPRSVNPWVILELRIDCHNPSKLWHLGNLVQVKPDSHLGWALPSMEHPSISFEYFFQDCLQVKCCYRASISSVEPPAIVWPKKMIWRLSSLKSPPDMKAAICPDEELNFIIIEHVFVG